MYWWRHGSTIVDCNPSYIQAKDATRNLVDPRTRFTVFLFSRQNVSTMFARSLLPTPIDWRSPTSLTRLSSAQIVCARRVADYTSSAAGEPRGRGTRYDTPTSFWRCDWPAAGRRTYSAACRKVQIGFGDDDENGNECGRSVLSGRTSAPMILL